MSHHTPSSPFPGGDKFSTILSCYFLGQSFVHTNTMRSGSEGRAMPGAHNGMGGAHSNLVGGNYTGTMRSQPHSREYDCKLVKLKSMKSFWQRNLVLSKLTE